MSASSMAANDFWMSAVRTRSIPWEDCHSPQMDGNDGNELACKMLDDEADGIARALQAVRSRRNRFSAASCMPLEILASIFSFAKQNESPHRILDDPGFTQGSRRFVHISAVLHKIGNPLPYRLGWIYVTHVCQRWREAALCHPRLWTDVDFTSLPSLWIKEMLLRSKMAPIYVKVEASINIEPDAVMEMVRLIAAPDIISRTRVLRLNDRSSGGKIRSALSLLCHPAPIMEQVFLDNDVFSPAEDFPIGLFASVAPRLAILRVSGFKGPYDSPLLANLERLELAFTPNPRSVNGVAVPGSHSPTSSQISTLIESIPRLRVLLLNDAFPLHPTHAPFPLHTYMINIPSRIQHIILMGHFGACADFACNLIVPASTKVTLKLFSINIRAPSLSVLLSKYGGRSRPPREIIFTVNAPMNQLITLDLFHGDPIPTSNVQKPMDNGGANTHFDLIRNPSGVTGDIGSICSSLHLDEIRKITFACHRHDLPPGVGPFALSFRNMWAAMNTMDLCWTIGLYTTSSISNGPLEEIRELFPTPALNGPTSSLNPATILNNLTSSGDSVPGDELEGATEDDQPTMTIANVPFPKLKTLRISENPRSGEHNREHEAEFIGALVECLRQRWMLGAGLNVLELPARFKGEERINLLRGETGVAIQ